MTNKDKQILFDITEQLKNKADNSTVYAHGYTEQYNGAVEVLVAFGFYKEFIKWRNNKENAK